MRDRSFDICIVGGCGHVGLPLGMAFADQGQNVVLYDINQATIDKVNHKVMPFMEGGADAVLAKVVDAGRLKATSDPACISQSQNVVMVIGTPVDEHLNPKLGDVIRAVKEIQRQLDDEQLLVLRSTVYPGVTAKIRDYLKSQGKSLDIAFCPERIAEGHALTELYSLPQIVSGFTQQAVERAEKLFKLLTPQIQELDPMEAELAKLFTNTWRYINFAISNQFFMIADSHGLDFYKIYNAMTKDYPRLTSFARAGFAAGPCLFKDCMQLSAFSDNNFFLGHSAMLVNEGLPDYIVARLRENHDLSNMTVGILGMAFKGGSDDPRESLSYRLKKKLELEVMTVLCTDVHIQSPDFVTVEAIREGADIVIVGAPHREYAALEFGKVPVVDIWNIYGRGGLIN